jgi:glycosyltransferase involved in cell wall biosynthesis
MSQKCTISLSLIIPIYNEEVLLQKALEETLHKLDADFEDFELILIDDGSRDNSVRIIKENYSQHPRVCFIENHINLNQGVTVQRGFKIASKEFVTFNGIDLPLAIDEIRAVLEQKKPETDLVVLERKIYSGATAWRKITSNVNFAIRRILFPQLAAEFSDMNFTQIYRRSVLNDIMPLAKSPAFTTPEFIFRAKLTGLQIEIMDANFYERKHGTGSLGKLHDILWTLYDMLRFRYLTWIGLDIHGKVK